MQLGEDLSVNRAESSRVRLAQLGVASELVLEPVAQQDVDAERAELLSASARDSA